MVDSHQVIRFLESRIRFGIKPGLHGMQKLLAAFGNPQFSYPVIHMAGTNGKGSTCSFLAAGCAALGLKTGLYTSPHIQWLNERIRINGTMISNESFLTISGMLQSEIETLNLTFFETITAVAFQFFADQNVDVAIIETGLGGRLDATNVVNPILTAITSVGLDHQQYLGDTPELIAGEKAGIIKPGVPVFVGPVSESVKNVIMLKAKQENSPVQFLERVSDDYLLQNRSLAETILDEFCVKRQLSGNKTYSQAMDRMEEVTGFRGRLQEVSDGVVTWILDAAHNPDGLTALFQALEQRYSGEPFPLLFGCVGDKQVDEMMKVIRAFREEIFLVLPEPSRGMTTEKLEESSQKAGLRFTTFGNMEEAIKSMEHRYKDTKVVVAGSLYLLGNFFFALNRLGKVKNTDIGLTMNQ